MTDATQTPLTGGEQKTTGNGKAAAPSGAAVPRSEKPETPEKVDVALEEAEPKPKTVTVRDTEFDLPDALPFAVFLASRTLRRSQRTNDDQQSMEAIVEIAEAYVGEEAYARFVYGMDLEEGSEATLELVEVLGEVYGTDAGESSASSDS